METPDGNNRKEGRFILAPGFSPSRHERHGGSASFNGGRAYGGSCSQDQEAGRKAGKSGNNTPKLDCALSNARIMPLAGIQALNNKPVRNASDSNHSRDYVDSLKLPCGEQALQNSGLTEPQRAVATSSRSESGLEC